MEEVKVSVEAAVNRHVLAKLGGMRKAQDFSVSPMSDGRVMIQSDRSIGTFDFRTGEGVLNTKGCYFPHLSGFMGAKQVQYPPIFVQACLDACPALDSQTVIKGSNGAVLAILENTVEVF